MLTPIAKNNKTIAHVTDSTPVITDAQSALDLLMTVKYDCGTKFILIPKELIAEDFFRLSSGFAGEILQKFINYGGKIAIYGDFSHYTSKSLRDFIRESNRGKDVFFLPTKKAAEEMLFSVI